MHLFLAHLGVVLHIGHSGVGGLDGVANDHLPQLVVEEGQDLLSSKCLPKEIFHHMSCILSDPGVRSMGLVVCL